MKILYIVPSLVQRGPVVVVNDLVKLMVANSHECEVYYFDEKEKPMAFECSVKQISAKHAVDFSNFDIVHSHGFRPDKYVAKYRDYSGKTKYITTLHNYVFQDLKYTYNVIISQIYGRIWMSTASKLDTIITLSKNARQYYRSIIKGNINITYAYNTRVIDLAKTPSLLEICELNKFKGNSTLIGMIGWLSNRKGVDYVIAALEKLPNYKLVVIGEGQERDNLLTYANKLGVSERCLFVGRRKDAYKYLPYFDIFAMPSRSEGFPLALLEAAAYGKACVTSDLPIFNEAFESEVEHFDRNSPTSIVSAIIRATKNSTELGRLIQKKYEEFYSPKAFYEMHMNIYKE